MATYRNIQMSFWTDSKILSEFSPEEKLMYRVMKAIYDCGIPVSFK